MEIVAALDDTEPNVHDVDVSANIVKPPADFADSPDGQRQPIQRIYKKLDRRLRSEERSDRRHYRSRQESARAKVHHHTNHFLCWCLVIKVETNSNCSFYFGLLLE